VIFPERFSKNTQVSGFMKVLQVGNESFHANRRTDIRIWWANSRFSKFCKRS